MLVQTGWHWFEWWHRLPAGVAGGAGTPLTGTGLTPGAGVGGNWFN